MSLLPNHIRTYDNKPVLVTTLEALIPTYYENIINWIQEPRFTDDLITVHKVCEELALRFTSEYRKSELEGNIHLVIQQTNERFQDWKSYESRTMSYLINRFTWSDSLIAKTITSSFAHDFYGSLADESYDEVRRDYQKATSLEKLSYIKHDRFLILIGKPHNGCYIKDPEPRNLTYQLNKEILIP